MYNDLGCSKNIVFWKEDNMHGWGMSLKLFQQSKKEGVPPLEYFLVIQGVSQMYGIPPMDDVLFSVWSAISLHNLKTRVLSFESFNIYCLF